MSGSQPTRRFLRHGFELGDRPLRCRSLQPLYKRRRKTVRIKAVLIGPDYGVLAAGAHDWENRQEGGYWTYRLKDVWTGVQDSLLKLREQFAEKYGARLSTVGAIGVSAKAIVVSLIDMGGRLRLICQGIECVEPFMKMPKLPVARVMWKPMPNLATGVEAWLIAGGAHHTVLSYDVSAGQMKDWARMMDIQFVHIDKDTTVDALEHDLFLSDLAWKLK